MRTNESTSQFFTSIIGLKPIAFFPNKDIFLNKVESDVLHVIYNKDALKEYRSKENPKIIRQVLNCYSYTNSRYKLGLPIIINPNYKLNRKIIKTKKAKFYIDIEKQPCAYEKIEFSIQDSYFKFHYNPYSKNFEKLEYSVKSLEELSIFIEELKKLITKLDINYCECLISAYVPEHQKLFLDNGFKPRGYIPSWNYNKKKKSFDDCIVFNYYKGSISKNLKIIPEVVELLNALNFFEKEENLINSR